ncbi:MAG: discoidin domain-containing protein [Bacteroidales bacterium]|nr:discoidin domain-containing protein [Bacteroidales bacterium]
MSKLTFIFLLISSFSHSQTVEKNGLIDSYTKQAIITEPKGNNPHFAIDGKLHTYWESENPLPDKYIADQTMNVFINTAPNRPISEINKIFDGDLNTAVLIKTAADRTKATFSIQLKRPLLLHYISIKAAIENNLKLRITYADKSMQSIDLKREDSYQLKAITPNKPIAIESISVSAASSFQLFELAALSTPPEVNFTIDLGTQKRIGQCYSRHFNEGNIQAINLQFSNNGNEWKTVNELNAEAIQLLPTVLEKPINTRFVRVNYILGWQEYGKAALWELKLFDEFGPYGPPADFTVIKQPLNQRLGLNMVWGWGQHVYSDQIQNGKGWQQYQNTFKKLRIYHNLLWDIKAPGISANYNQMLLGQGTAANWWLNWEREYGFLKQKGFDITTTLMFKNENIPVSLWTNPAENAYNIGAELGRFLGQKNLAEAVEVGNEPWDYPPEFYRILGENMASGLKANSSKAKILPAAFQNSYKSSAFNDQQNFLPDFVSTEMLKKVDKLNVHFYSHTIDSKGYRISVPPEDPRSEIHGIRNTIRYRNENAKEKAVWVTEFGYDGNNAQEPCLHSECVSEAQQAAWGLRATFYLLRQGAERAYWYFYANEATDSHLHSRAGLTLSATHNFEPKASYFAFKDALEILGDYYFSAVLIESDELVAYQFTHENSNKKYIVAWIPNSQDPKDGNWFTNGFMGSIQGYFILDGKPNNSWLQSENQNKFFLSGFPRVFEVSE